MDSLRYQKDIPLLGAYDVVVLGAGPSGIAAAIASARNGAKTILIEKYGSVGGSATNSLVGPFMTSYDADGKTQIIRGIFDELIRRMEKKGKAIHPSKVNAGSPYVSFIIPGHDKCAPFEPDALRIEAADMLMEAGVKLLLHTSVIDIAKDGDRISSVIISNKSGIQYVTGGVIVDCTGDADAAFMAGVPMLESDAASGTMQPASMFFRLRNVDTDKVAAIAKENRHRMKPFHGLFSWLLEEQRAKGNWKVNRGEVGMYETTEKGVYRINTSRIMNVDGTNAEDLTRAEVEGRKQVMEIIGFFREYVPGFENAELVDIAPAVGIRETRHIRGEYVVTREDVENAVIFDDKVMLASNSIDIHAEGQKEGGDYTTIKGGYYSIPYRALVPVGIENLLVAGRSISASSAAFSAFRVMTCCMGIGEAAGTAAAIAARHRVAPRNIDIKELQATLVEKGAYLG